MENFVLNLFSDQLSKIILDFHQSEINANFLSGKGSIRNVKLNVGLINDFLNKPPHGTVPFLEFTEITLSELRVEVTSYTNLKKAPIVLVIEEIYAKAREPLEYHVDPSKNNAHKNKIAAAKKNEIKSPSQPYGLLHRILDNLSVRIKHIYLSFSSLGKFKTRRRGVWTPPTLKVCLDDVEWIGVTETGNPGTPDMVWAHNELSFKGATNQRHRSCTIYKKLSMMCHIKLLSSGDQKRTKGLQSNSGTSITSESASSLLSNTKVDVYLGYVRRLRDASVRGADLDVVIHNVDINLDVASYNKKSSSATSGCDLGLFVHMLVGLLHCYYKDRSFVDPFSPDGVESAHEVPGVSGLLRGFNSLGTVNEKGKDDGAEAGPDAFLPEVALMDDDLDSSDESDYVEEPDEENDEAFLAWKKKQDQKGEARANECTHAEQGEKNDGSNLFPESQEQIGGESKMSTTKDGGDDRTPAKSKSYKPKRKAVVVIASGAQKFEKLSFSLSIPRINMKICLPHEIEMMTEPNQLDKDNGNSKNHHCLELLLEGLVAECIWPKNNSGDMGGHVQGSIKYFHVIDSVYHKGWGIDSGIDGPKPWNVEKIFPLLRIGTRVFQGHDAFSLSPHLTPMNSNIDNFSKCDEFPLMADRQVTWRWDRQLNSPRALAFKSTISFVDEALTLWSKTNVVHEASLGKIEIVLDSRPLRRLANLFSNPLDQCNLWFDERWLSGKWQDEINTDIIAGNFSLKDHLQPLPSLYPTGNKQSALSSELRSITAHLDSVTVRLPNPMEDLSSFRMAEIIFSMSEATLLVSSDLPSSFLSGGINAENTSHDFPHDPSDISCKQSSTMSSEHITTFRMQISLSNCGLKIVPIQAYSSNQAEHGFSNVLAPTNVTMMMSLEQKESPQNKIEKDTDAGSASQSLILSVLVHHLESNIELRSIYGALETLKYHASNIMKDNSSSSNVDEVILTNSRSADEDIAVRPTFSVICIHVPELDLNLWGELQPSTSTAARLANEVYPLQTNQKMSLETQLKHNLLCRVQARQFEFGMEFTNLLLPTEKQSTGAVHKCGLQSVLVEICSQNVGGATFKMIKILSLGNETSVGAHLVEKVSAFCFPGDRVSKRGFFLRSENESDETLPSTSANSVEIASPLIVDLSDLNAIEFFLNLLVECLLAPVFVASKTRFRQIGQIPLGSAMWEASMKLSSLLSTPQSKMTENNDEGGDSLFRLFLYRLLVLVPSKGYDSFGLLFNDVEVAIGESQCNNTDVTSCYRRVVGKHCGYRDQTWLKQFHLLGEGTTSSNSFYALRSKHSLLGLGKSEAPTIVIPETSINWSLPVGLGCWSSNAPPFDVFAMKDLGLSLMDGASPLSSLYFKLYKLSQNGSAQSDFSLAATRLHNSIGSYHRKMHGVICQMNAEVESLRNAVFSKENERVGALALASSVAAGWVRVGEDLSFSHRIFSSATFYKYWMVLDRSLLILHKAPGDTKPSFIIPLRQASTRLHSLSSNKSTSGIVGNHMQQKGFAVFDSTEGTCLFFVTSNDSDYKMWTTQISMVLKKEEIMPDIISNVKEEERAISDITSAVNHRDNIKPMSATDLVDPAASSMAHNNPFGDINGASTASAPPQASEKTATHTGLLDVSDSPPPIPISKNEISPAPVASVTDSERMDDEEMEDISLSDSEKIPNNLSTISETVPSSNIPVDSPASSSPPLHVQEPANTSLQSLPMRERLALAKGKSKIASSRFGSALKTAKGGMLAAASESSRVGVKQAVVKETPHKEELKRSFAVGQKMSMLKRNANTKLAAARSSMQDQIHVRTEDSSEQIDVASSSSRDELSGNRKLVVGQKMSLLKKNAGTKLTSLNTAVRSSLQDPPPTSGDTDHSPGPSDLLTSSSQSETSANRSAQQELRKKLASLDQSVSNTMRRLKIDEKMTQLSAAVKSGVKNDPVVRLGSRSGDHSRQRLGIGEESKLIKPIRFDARETFCGSSELPLKVKSISSGDALIIDDHLSEKIESLQKIEGSWVVAVDAVNIVEANCLDTEIANHHALALQASTDPQNKPAADNQVCNKWKYRIMAIDAMCETDGNAQASVERSLSEVLLFHTKISEIIAKHLPSTAEVMSQEGFSPVFHKLSTIEHLRVSGSILQRVTEINLPAVSSSSLVKVFLSSILQCHMPEEAIMTTKIFLGIGKSQSEAWKDDGMNSAKSADEAYGLLSNVITLEKQPSSQSKSLNMDPECDQPYSSLLNVIMDGYAKAMKERDEALASLATTSIINENRIMQERLAKSNRGLHSQSVMKWGPKTNSSDEEDMLTLCKQLGNEIALRTAAESEINRLNERLKFERKIAETKENELRKYFAQNNAATNQLEFVPRP